MEEKRYYYKVSLTDTHRGRCISEFLEKGKKASEAADKLAAELGGEIIPVQSKRIPDSIIEVCREKQISTVCIGKPAFTLVSVFRACFQYRKLLNSLSQMNIDLIILA